MPVFGDSAAALGLGAGGMAFGSDDWAPNAATPQEESAAPETAEPGPEPTANSDADPAPEAKDELKAKDKAPSIDGPPAEPDTTIEPATQDTPQTSSAATAEPEHASPTEEEAPPPAPVAEDEQPHPITDPTLDQPIAPLAAEPEPASAPLPPAATNAAEPELPLPASATPKASRGKIEGPSQRPITAERPDETPSRPSAAPTLTTGPMPEATAEDSAESATGPVLGFAARRGKVPKPETATGDLVSNRPSRLAFGASTEGDAPPVLHPDAAPGRATPVPARPGNRLAAQLARVRDASKLAPQTSAAEPSRSPAPLDDLAETDEIPEVAAHEAATTEQEGFGFTRRRPGDATPPPAAPASGDSAFSSGLLARKPVEAAGPSFKTGLILTLILLVLLALIAIWSALFLPDSPIARLFGGGDRDSSVVIDDPLDAPAPPLASTAPPAMGALDTGTAEPEAQDSALAAAETEAATVEAALDPVEPVEPVEPEALAEAAPEPVLPDIDADLDLPPLPPLPEDMLPSLEETERIYAEDGIWPRTPERPTLAALSTSNEIYVASIDPEVPVTDAIALADPALDPGELLRRVPPPPPFGVTPDRDARGLVTPTPEGVLTPEGAFVVLGRPSVEAIPRPREEAPATEAEVPQIDVEDAILGTFQPTPRPSDLDETRERQVLGGFSTTELAALRPGPRPVSAQEAAAQASLFPQAGPQAAEEAPDTEAVAAAPVIEGTPRAVASSRLPAARPGNIEALVAAAQATAPAVPQEAIARAPSIPSNADVTRAATERNAIRLRDINLIGVTGTPNDRRALVRLPSGRFVRVGVGDRLDGGRVAAIGENSLQYVRNGRNVTLEIPG
jgi:hypothetical protein